MENTPNCRRKKNIVLFLKYLHYLLLFLHVDGVKWRITLMKFSLKSDAFWSATSTLRWLMAASRYWTHRCSRRRMWNCKHASTKHKHTHIVRKKKQTPQLTYWRILTNTIMVRCWNDICSMRISFTICPYSYGQVIFITFSSVASLKSVSSLHTRMMLTMKTSASQFANKEFLYLSAFW